jgi:ADP-ribosylation factor protein 1
MKLGPLKQLTRNSVDFEPTTAMNYEVVKHLFNSTKFAFHTWDLAGSVHLRSMWQHYYTSVRVDVVVFVVDALDKTRLDEARETFQCLLHDPALATACKIVLLNVKGPEDPEGAAARTASLRAKLGLAESAHCRAVKVIEVNPEHENAGIKPALDWICQKLMKIDVDE